MTFRNYKFSDTRSQDGLSIPVDNEKKLDLNSKGAGEKETSIRTQIGNTGLNQLP